MIVYPGAKWRPLLNHSAPGRISDRNTIVLHITDGSTAEGAIATFQTSQTPHRVSAHFVIDRDGTVYQLVDCQDTAWHASQVNSHSIGIEHAAIAATPSGVMGATPGQPGLPCTPEQYAASAALVVWLANELKVPIDRAHIRTHNEASPRDGHVLCCTGALDPDKVVGMAKELHDQKNPQVPV